MGRVYSKRGGVVLGHNVVEAHKSSVSPTYSGEQDFKLIQEKGRRCAGEELVDVKYMLVGSSEGGDVKNE